MGSFREKYSDPPFPGRRVTLSLVNFSERLYEKNVDPFARANRARTCSDCLPLPELTPLGEPCKLFIVVGR